MANNLTIKVNDIALPLNSFVQKIFSSVILGLLDSLDRVPQPIERLTIEINTPEKEENKE